MTSRCEYRLVCRQDNADARLMEKGRELGLVSEKRLAETRAKEELVREEIRRCESTVLPPSQRLNDLLVSRGTSPIENNGATVAELIRRPQISYDCLSSVDEKRPDLPKMIRELVETEIKYAGYIKRQLGDIEQQKKMEDFILPEDVDYSSIITLRIEAREKLGAVRPRTLGQASRISGVSPADIGALTVWLSHREDKK